MVEPPERGWMERLSAVYKVLLETGFLLLPLGGAVYLWLFQNPPLVFHDFLLHELAIAVAIVLPLFAAWISYRCYRANGEPSLRYVTLAFLGFALVYAPHGILTRDSPHHLWLFILYGPASRLVLTGFFFLALRVYRRPAEPPPPPLYWLRWTVIFLIINVVVAVLAMSPLGGLYVTRFLMEGGSIALALAGILVLHRGRTLSNLMWTFQAAEVSFAVASLTFLLTTAWTHLWWYAHAVFAAGFFVLSHGLMRAFLTTRSIANIYSEEEIASRLAAREAEAATLHAAQARLEALLESCPIGIMVTDTMGVILFCNAQQAVMFGLQPTQVEGRNVRDFLAETEDGDGPLPSDILFLGGAVTSEQEYRRADGNTFRGLVTQGPILFEGRPAVVEWSLDITERHQAAEAMKLARHLAEVASRAKTDFLAAMSHELRTPLNAISGFAEMMHSELLGPLGSQTYREYCGFILESGRHLTDLINDVLDVAAVETGKVELFDRRVTVDRLAEAVTVMVGNRARARKQILTYSLDENLPALMVDERRVKQVLINLLGNAVKFTPEGGSITLRAWGEPDGGVTLAIQDSGVGMSPEDQKQALAPFGQIRNSMVRDNDGVGIGLPLSNRLMEIHGGKLEIHSALGQGTTILLKFPAWRSLN